MTSPSTRLRILSGLSLLLGCALSASADVSLSGVAPTADILATTTLGSIDTSLFPLTGTAPAPIVGNDNHGRGQLFSLGDGTGSAFQITAIVVQKNGAATFDNDLLTLRIFQGSEEEWITGTGHLASDPSFYNGTGVTPLAAEVFTLNGLIEDDEFVTLELATPLTVRERADFGFFLTYDPSTGTSPDRFRHLETTGGGRISVTTESHGTSSRRMNFFVLGTAIDGGLVTASSTAPGADLIASSPLGSVDTALFDEDANANHARGQLFTLPNGPGLEYEVTSLTLKKSTLQTFLNDRLTLHLFEGTEAQWTTGTGHTTAANGSDYYAGTTVTPLHREVFTLNGTYQDGDFITFQLGSPILVREDADFGFFFTYDQAGAASPDRFRHIENGTGGGRLSISTESHGATSANSRKVLYYLQGTPIGEGSPLTLGSPFQDRMVLQRGKPVLVWGKAEPASSVTVSINGVSATATTDAGGHWEAEVPTLPAGGPYLLEVTSGSQSESISDVLVGDVWFCFGQSNMVFTLNQMAAWHTAYENEIIANDNIRCLKIDQDASLNEEQDAGMSWLANSTAGTWTAVGSVFASRLHQATGVPVAIVWAAYGSSSIESWMPSSLSEDFPHFGEMMTLYQSVGEYRSGTPTSARLPSSYPSNQAWIADLTASGWTRGNNDPDIFIRTRPNILYNKMVHPMTRYRLSGFVWYQGEANASNILDCAQYGFTLPKFVTEYRARFGQGDLPFLGVQLPSHEVANWPWFREAQDRLETVPNAHVAVTLDTGNPSNIHPTDKEPIGIRLANLARQFALGEPINALSPRFDSLTVSGNEATVTFQHGEGLNTSRAVTAAQFELAGSDQVFYPAESAVVVGSSVVMSSPSVPAPVAVRYAWSPSPLGLLNLVNGEGLPAAPFRTDDWPLPGLGAQAPQSVNDTYTLPRDGTLAVPASGVLGNDIDLNRDSLTASTQMTTTHGLLTLLGDGSLTYQPEPGFAGIDTFTYTVSDGQFTSAPAAVTLTVEGEPSGYYTWRQSITWNPGQDEGSTGDPDGDGLSNFLEFALGLDPLLPDLTGLPALAVTETGADFSFSNSQPGIVYEVLTSPDLVTWSEPAFATLTSESPMPVSIPASAAVGGRLFVRLRVSE